MSNYSPVKLAFKVFEPAQKGNSSDLIFIHGITACKETWYDIAQNVAEKSKRRTYTLDMRNHGDTAWSDEFGWRMMAEDVAHFMDEHSIKSATLIGHSMGGIISMILALTQPEKVDAMIIEDISPKLPSGEIKNAIASLIGMIKDSLQKITPDMDQKIALKNIMEEISKNMPPEFRTPPEHQEKFAAHMKNFFVKKGGKLEPKMNVDVLKAFLLDDEQHKSVGLEGVFNKPALFIYGTISPFKVIDGKDHILGLFPKATFQAIEGATHLVHIEFPEEYSETALKFLHD